METPEKKAKKTQNTERAIYEAAKKLFFKNGIADTSVRQITAASNTNLGSFTYYFKSKTELAQQIFENVNNDIRALIVTPYDRQATLYEYLFMQMFQFKAAVLNDRYYELFSLSMSEEATSKSVKELYYGCNIRFSSHSSTDSAYFIMTSALLIGMKSELIRLSRNSDMDEITLDKTLDFFVKELLEFIHPAEVDDLDEYRQKLLSDFDAYYVDIVKGFTPVLVKTGTAF